MKKAKQYIKIGNKWCMSTILQMRTNKKVKLGPKSKRRDYSCYSPEIITLLMNSMQKVFGTDNAKLVVEHTSEGGK